MKPITMQKHAYLIMAHNEPFVFRQLLMLLDDERNDLFVHVDRKADVSAFEYVPRHSRIVYADRLDVRWGGFSQIAAELALMELATACGTYAYYHLLSGVDLPLKSQDEIHRFFDSQPEPREFVGFAQYTDKAWIERAHYYHPFVERQKSGGKRLQRIMRGADKMLVAMQKAMGVSRRFSWEFKKGPQWFSITDGCCRYLLAQKQEIERSFKHIVCVDEWFVQTLLYNDEHWRARLYDTTDEFGACLRAIDWQRGSAMSPYTWGDNPADFELLVGTNRLFARKFSARYTWLVNKITELILNTKTKAV